jgi:hypothetical protein
MQVYNSRFYDPALPRWRIYQEHLLQKLGIFAALWMLAILYRLFTNGEMLVFSLVSFGLTLVLANVAAGLAMGALPAQIVFSGNAFAIYSVQDKLRGGTGPNYFPVSYSALRSSHAAGGGKQRVMIHYHDRVLYLDETDWPDFFPIVDQLRFADLPTPNATISPAQNPGAQ